MTDTRPNEGEWNPEIKLSDEKGKYTGDTETISWGIERMGGSRIDSLFIIIMDNNTYGDLKTKNVRNFTLWKEI